MKILFSIITGLALAVAATAGTFTSDSAGGFSMAGHIYRTAAGTPDYYAMSSHGGTDCVSFTVTFVNDDVAARQLNALTTTVTTGPFQFTLSGASGVVQPGETKVFTLEGEGSFYFETAGTTSVAPGYTFTSPYNATNPYPGGSYVCSELFRMYNSGSTIIGYHTGTLAYDVTSTAYADGGSSPGGATFTRTTVGSVTITATGAALPGSSEFDKIAIAGANGDIGNLVVGDAEAGAAAVIQGDLIVSPTDTIAQGDLTIAKTSTDADIVIATTGAGNFRSSIGTQTDDSSVWIQAFDDGYTGVANLAGKSSIWSGDDLVIGTSASVADLYFNAGGLTGTENRLTIDGTTGNSTFTGAAIAPSMQIGSTAVAGRQFVVDGTSPVLSRMVGIGSSEYGWTEWVGDTNNLRIGVYGFTSDAQYSNYRLRSVIEETATSRGMTIISSGVGGSLKFGASGKTASSVEIAITEGKVTMGKAADSAGGVYDVNVVSGTGETSTFGVGCAGTGPSGNAELWSFSGGGDLGLVAYSNTYVAIPNFTGTGVVTTSSYGGMAIVTNDATLGDIDIYVTGNTDADRAMKIDVNQNVNIGTATSIGKAKFSVEGSVAFGYSAQTGTYTATISDHVINCTANTFTVTLPTAVGIAGRQYVVKNSGTGVITVDGDAAETIDGATTVSLPTQYDAITLASDGANWVIW